MMANLPPIFIPPANADPPVDLSCVAVVVDARRLAAMLCSGIRTVRTWDALGKIPAPVRIGGRVVWRVDEIHAWLAAGAPNRDEWEARRAARKTFR